MRRSQNSLAPGTDCLVANCPVENADDLNDSPDDEAPESDVANNHKGDRAKGATDARGLCSHC